MCERRGFDRVFGQRLRRCRNAAGKTLQEVGDHIGVSRMYLSFVERGKRGPLGVDKLKKTAAFLKVNPKPLFEARLRARACRGGAQLPLEHLAPDVRKRIAWFECAWLDFKVKDIIKIGKHAKDVLA